MNEVLEPAFHAMYDIEEATKNRQHRVLCSIPKKEKTHTHLEIKVVQLKEWPLPFFQLKEKKNNCSTLISRWGKIFLV